MIEFVAENLCDAFVYLCADIRHLMEEEHTDPSKVLNDSYRYYVANGSLKRVITEVDRLELGTKLSHKVKVLRGNLVQPDYRCTVEVMLNVLLEIQRDVRQELHARKFAYFPSPYHEYFEQEKLFGDAVHKTIPEAQQDLKDAGNCFAAGLFTACVFHLTRVAEHGLRRLARRVQPNLVHKGKPTPIEYEDINKICTAIKNKLDNAHTISLKPKKKLKVQLYADAADHCLFMKDIWRNDISHTGKPYTEPEAKAAMERIREFAQFLAKSLKKL